MSQPSRQNFHLICPQRRGAWYHSQKEGCGAFLGQEQMGPALPPILAAIPPPSSNFGL